MRRGASDKMLGGVSLESLDLSRECILRRVGNRIVSRMQNLSPDCLDSIQFNSIQFSSIRHSTPLGISVKISQCTVHGMSESSSITAYTSPERNPGPEVRTSQATRRRYEIRRVRTSLSPLIPSKSQSLLVTLRHPPLHNPASPSPASLTSAFQRESPITCIIRYRTVHGSSGSFLCTNMRVCLSLPD